MKNVLMILWTFRSIMDTCEHGEPPCSMQQMIVFSHLANLPAISHLAINLHPSCT